jgi:ribosomal protein S18 acetylase RimI-like enzyme
MPLDGEKAFSATPPVLLQPVTPEDYDELLALALAFHLEDGHPLDQGGERALREICTGHPLARGFLIREAGATLGYCVLTRGFGIEFGGPDAFLDDLYLVPEARGRGIGNAVMAAVEHEARRQGATAIHLVVASENERAQRLYLRSGFARSDYLVMSRRL